MKLEKFTLKKETREVFVPYIEIPGGKKIPLEDVSSVVLGVRQNREIKRTQEDYFIVNEMINSKILSPGYDPLLGETVKKGDNFESFSKYLDKLYRELFEWSAIRRKGILFHGEDYLKDFQKRLAFGHNNS